MAKAKISITTENRSGSAADAAAKEQRTEMPLSDLHPFEGHPFKVLDDELMEQTVESIKQIGVVSPLIVRPDPEGGYEILSGHRRLHAAQLAGLETVPVIVKEMDDDAAIIFMVDSNLQRENILPSERAFSYKMKLEAMKHQGTRNDLETTSRQVVGKLEAADTIGEQTGESGRQVQRFIRLTNLIPEILDMVDEKKIAFNPAVELSYLKPSEQKEFLEAMDYAQASPSLSQAQRPSCAVLSYRRAVCWALTSSRRPSPPPAPGWNRPGCPPGSMPCTATTTPICYSMCSPVRRMP